MLTECIARTGLVSTFCSSSSYPCIKCIHIYISFSRRIDLYDRWPPPARPPNSRGLTIARLGFFPSFYFSSVVIINYSHLFQI